MCRVAGCTALFRAPKGIPPATGQQNHVNVCLTHVVVATCFQFIYSCHHSTSVKYVFSTEILIICVQELAETNLELVICVHKFVPPNVLVASQKQHSRD